MCLPAADVDAEVLEDGFQAVFKALLLSSHRSFALVQLAVQHLFRQSAVWHPDDVSSPSGLCYLLEGEDVGHIGSLKDLRRPCHYLLLAGYGEGGGGARGGGIVQLPSMGKD